MATLDQSMCLSLSTNSGCPPTGTFRKSEPSQVPPMAGATLIVEKVLDTAPNTVVIGKYRLDPVAEFEGPRMQPPAMFTKTDPQHLARLLERTPAGSYDEAANQLFT